MDMLLLEHPKASLDGFHRYIGESLHRGSSESDLKSKVAQYRDYLDNIMGHKFETQETKFSKHSHWGPYAHWIECHWGADPIPEKKSKSESLNAWLKKHHPEVYQEFKTKKAA